uniref:EF-hand domain-containing protein n=1 Tax=Knipowitschia caucasica TaxID=637954 RepID=A0AAV2KBH6_KNICA
MAVTRESEQLKNTFKSKQPTGTYTFIHFGQPREKNNTKRMEPQTEDHSGSEFDTDLEESDPPPDEQYPFLHAWTTEAVSMHYNNHRGDCLNMNHFGLGPQGAKALAKILKTDSNITTLELEDNNLQTKGTDYVADMLQINSNISSLNLSKNDLCSEGAQIISKIMLDNYHVKCMRLSGNGFDDVSAKYLADALKGDYVIRELDLSHNKFSTIAGGHLGQMIGVNLGIEVLNLSWNNINMKGAVALCSGLKINSTLKHLFLAANGFSSYVAEALSQTLKLPYNTISSAGALTLLKAVDKSTGTGLEDIDISTVVVCEAFLQLLGSVQRKFPKLSVQYTALPDVTERVSALPLFKKHLQENMESLMEYFRAVDKDGTMKISTVDFRNITSAEMPLTPNQLEWLVKTFDSQCTATINYSQFYKMV